MTPEEMKARMLASDRRWQFQRWQVIYLMSSKGFRAKQTAEVVGVAKGTVYQWVHRYNHHGPEALVLRGRGGRRKGLMSWGEEIALLEQLSREAKRGAVVIARRVREAAQQKLGQKVSKDYAYDVLHRHG